MPHEIATEALDAIDYTACPDIRRNLTALAVEGIASDVKKRVK